MRTLETRIKFAQVVGNDDKKKEIVKKMHEISGLFGCNSRIKLIVVSNTDDDEMVSACMGNCSDHLAMIALGSEVDKIQNLSTPD